MPADIPLRLLDQARIASPCDMRWEDMTGDDRSRFCAKCQLHVHNIASMTSAEAETLLRSKLEGRRVCARIYRRFDGTILTRDCPVGLRAARQRLIRISLRAAAALAFILSAGILARASVTNPRGSRLRAIPPVAWLSDQVAKYLIGAPPVPMGAFVSGDIAVPPPTQQQPVPPPAIDDSAPGT